MLVIKVDNIIDRLILNMMILEIMLFRWMDIMGYTSVIILVLACIAFIKYIHLYGDVSGIFIVGAIVAYNFFEYYLYGGSRDILLHNMFKMTKAFAIMAYMLLVFMHNRDFLISFMKEKFLVFNFFILINIPITFLQIIIGNFLIGMRSYTYKWGNPDYISGFFGMYGTPCMGVYLCMIFVLNYSFLCNKYVKKVGGFLIYNLAVLIYYFILFIFNDNKGAYFMFVMTLLLTFVAASNRGIMFSNSFSQLLYNTTYIVRGSILALVLLWILNQFSGIHATFVWVLDMLMDAVKSTTYKSYGGAQRISIILRAIRGTRRWWGFGLGNIIIKNNKAFGYDNFGLADLGYFLMEGGIAYIILWIVLMSSIFQKIFKNIFLVITIIVYLLTFAFYTQIFVDTSSFCSVIFLMIALAMIYHGDSLAIQDKSIWRDN